MEELIFKLWPYFERAGLVAGVIMSAWLYFTRKELKDLRTQHDASQKERIEDGKNAISVIEKNTAATNALAELIRERRR